MDEFEVNANYKDEPELVRLVEEVAEYGGRRMFVGTKGDKDAIRRYADEVRKCLEGGRDGGIRER